MQFRKTAVCIDSDTEGTYRHIVRRYAAKVRPNSEKEIVSNRARAIGSFTRKCNAASRRTPATNPDWGKE